MPELGAVRRFGLRVARGERPREAVLLAAVLAPVLLDRERRRNLAALDPWHRALLGILLGSALAGQYGLGSRSFPFVDWEMYTRPVSGDPIVVEYHAVLRSGARAPLSFQRILGTNSAGRLMEAVRRQVIRLQRLPAGDSEAAAVRREHQAALRAIARRYGGPDDPVIKVLVSEREVSIASGQKGPPRALWEVVVG